MQLLLKSPKNKKNSPFISGENRFSAVCSRAAADFCATRGGVSLARSPEQISLLEVVEAIDGPILLNECVSESSGTCTFNDDCPMRPVWCDVQVELISRLKTTNFDPFPEERRTQETNLVPA